MINNTEMFEVLRVSQSEFLSKDFAKNVPSIITDVVPRWNATNRWTDTYLSEVLKGKQVDVGVSQSHNFDYDTENPQFSNQQMEFSEALCRINSKEQHGESYYLMQKPIAQDFPELLGDLVQPSWLDIQQAAPHIWIGAAGNFTSLHYDISENYIGQVKGQKTFILYDTQQLEHLYPNPLESTLSHVSRVDITKPDFDAYPLFRKANAIEFVLDEGEMLFLPSHWWHAVRSESNSIMVNYWRFYQNLNFYLTDPTAIRSLWFMYKINLLQSLKQMIVEAETSYIECALKLKNKVPNAAILLAHAAIANTIFELIAQLNLRVSNPMDFNASIELLVSRELLTTEALDDLQEWRFLVLQTYSELKIDAVQIDRMISRVRRLSEELLSVVPRPVETMV